MVRASQAGRDARQRPVAQLGVVHAPGDPLGLPGIQLGQRLHDRDEPSVQRGKVSVPASAAHRVVRAGRALGVRQQPPCRPRLVLHERTGHTTGRPNPRGRVGDRGDEFRGLQQKPPGTLRRPSAPGEVAQRVHPRLRRREAADEPLGRLLVAHGHLCRQIAQDRVPGGLRVLRGVGEGLHGRQKLLRTPCAARAPPGYGQQQRGLEIGFGDGSRDPLGLRRVLLRQHLDEAAQHRHPVVPERDGPCDPLGLGEQPQPVTGLIEHVRPPQRLDDLDGPAGAVRTAGEQPAQPPVEFGQDASAQRARRRRLPGGRGLPPGEQTEQGGAQRVKVGTLVERTRLLRLAQRGDAEVAQFHRAVVRQQHAGRLHLAVHQARGVGRGQRVGHLRPVVEHGAHRKAVRRTLQLGAEVPASPRIQHEERTPFVLPDVQRLGADPFVLRRFDGRHPDRHRPPQKQVDALPDLTPATTTHRFLQPVTTRQFGPRPHATSSR
jgi:hypothetical protein